MNALTEYSSPLIYESEYGGYTDDFDIFCGTVTKSEALVLPGVQGVLHSGLLKLGYKVHSHRYQRSDAWIG